MISYKETVNAAKSSRSPKQLAQANEIQARNKRYFQQKHNFRKYQEGKVDEMLQVFRPRIIDLNNN